MAEWKSLLQRARRSVIVQNAAALYAIQGAGYLLPLVTLPYLARVLRPDGWGLVVFAQAFAIWLSLLIHYGFAFSGTRAIAQCRHDPVLVEDTVAGVQAAKLGLVGVAVVAGIAAWLLVPAFQENPAYLAWGWLAGVLQGLNPSWYFQGVERLRRPAIIEVAAKALATVGVFMFVRAPAHGWGVLALGAMAELVATGVLTVDLYREVRFRAARIAEMVRAFRDGWALFVFASAASLYTIGNAFVLGILATPREVSFFGGADRMVRAASMLLAPISKALYPRVSHLMATDPQRAARLIRRSMIPFVAVGATLSASLFFAAPILTRVALGPGYEPAIDVIRMLSVIPTLLGLGTVLGLQWALPVGLDRPYSRMVVAAGAANLILAFFLVPRFGALGMAISAVLAEASVEAGLVVLAFRHRSGLWRNGGTLNGDTRAPSPAALAIGTSLADDSRS